MSLWCYSKCLSGITVDDLKDGHVGAPVSCSRIKLVSWEEGNYRVTDNPPSGEVWIGGPCVASGYFKNPEQTAEDFTEQNGIRWVYHHHHWLSFESEDDFL